MSVVALTAIAFLYQIFRLDDLQTDWNGMKDSVAVVETVGGENQRISSLAWFVRSEVDDGSGHHQGFS